MNVAFGKSGLLRAVCAITSLRRLACNYCSPFNYYLRASSTERVQNTFLAKKVFLAIIHDSSSLPTARYLRRQSVPLTVQGTDFVNLSQKMPLEHFFRQKSILYLLGRGCSNRGMDSYAEQNSTLSNLLKLALARE